MKKWLFGKQLSSLSPPSSSKINQLLQQCANSRALSQSKQVHQQIISLGFHQNPFFLTKLIQIYADCNCLHYAQNLFDKLPQPNIFSWTSILAFYSRNSLFEECLWVYSKMRFYGVLPDHYVFPKILRSCAQLKWFELGVLIHKDVIFCGCDWSLEVCNSLVDMYSKCEDVDSARKVFDFMGMRDLLSWNSMISGYVANGFCEFAIELFEFMRNEGVESDTVTWNSIMDAYCEMGLCEEALKVFVEIKEPNVISWTTLISGFAKIGKHQMSLKIFANMMSTGSVIPDLGSLSSAMVSCRNLKGLRNGQEIHGFGIKTHCGDAFYASVGPALLTMYSSCGRIHDARNVFESMDKNDVVSRNAMILGYVDLDMGHLALECFTRMQTIGVKNDRTTLSTILPVCDLESGKQIHAHILRNGFESSVPVLNALIFMYSKQGSVRTAHFVFSNADSKDLVSWNTMIHGFGINGLGLAAIELMQEMAVSGLRPDSVTITSVLAACSHSGLVDQGLELFRSMKKRFDLDPKMEHFGCVVDMLARAGRIEESVDVIRTMPQRPDKHIWGTLLAASEGLQNFQIAAMAAENLVQMEPKNGGHYVSLYNIYAGEGRWDDAIKVRRAMEERGLVKLKGTSWIERGR